MLLVDGRSLTGAKIAEAAESRESVQLTPEGRQQAEASYRFGVDVVTRREVYGRSTGVGANRTISLRAGSDWAVALLRSHATSAGAVRSAIRIRAMLIVRLNQLAAGGSGVDPAIVDALADMINRQALPAIRENAGIGTGDLSALATTALALMGEAVTSEPLAAFVRFSANDALPFMSSNAASLADAALAAADLRRLTEAGLVVAGLSFTALRGNPEAFSAAVDRVTPFAGTRKVNAVLRALVGTGGDQPARIQDPYGLRALPQAGGALLDALDALDATITAMLNAPSENPVLLASVEGTLDPDAGLAHHGGFHAVHLQLALDHAVIAVAQTAQLVLARLASLIEPTLTGLPAFLGDGSPGASGVMIVEYVAASSLGDLRAAATPAGIQSVTLSRGVEESASFASLAARQALAAVESFRILISCELVAAVRALRMREDAVLSPSIATAFAHCEPLPSGFADRDLSPDLELAASLLSELAPHARLRAERDGTAG